MALNAQCQNCCCEFQRRQSELYDLGDRLSEKLLQQRAEMGSKLGNYSCVLKEMKYVDEDLEIDLQNILDSLERMNFRDDWILQQSLNNARTCYAVCNTHSPSIMLTFSVFKMRKHFSSLRNRCRIVC